MPTSADGQTSQTSNASPQLKALFQGGASDVMIYTEGHLRDVVAQLVELEQLVEIAKRRLTDNDLFFTVLKETMSRTEAYPHKFAEKLGVSGSTMSRWMNREAAPRAPNKPTVYKAVLKITGKELKQLRKQLAVK